MRVNMTSRRLFFVALAVVVATNAIILMKVGLNRFSGEKRVITLTERELSAPYRHHRENSGFSLNIRWSVLDDENDYGYRTEPKWLDQDKLEVLGFSLEKPTDKDKNRYRGYLSKEVFVVLEYSGAHYQKALERAKREFEKETSNYAKHTDQAQKWTLDQAETRLKRMENASSRLYAVDAGTNVEQLRERYSDAGTYMIVRGVVQPLYNSRAKTFSGYIQHLSIDKVNVPLAYRKVFNRLERPGGASYGGSHPPRYTVKLAYGSSYEPWIESVELIR